jgi:hypothetical protein
MFNGQLESECKVHLLLPVFILVVTMFWVLGSVTQYTNAVNVDPILYAKDSRPLGLSYGEWAARWQQWMISVPAANNPTNDQTGKNCALAQGGPVWFLTGTTGGAAVRSCNVPSTKAIFFPIIVSECDYASYPNVKKVNELIACARQDVNSVTTLDASVDGLKLTNLNAYRVTSPLFSLNIPAGNIFGAPAGQTQAVIDGYVLMLHPLSPGTHKIHFFGLNPGNPNTSTENYLVDVTYNLEVK